MGEYKLYIGTKLIQAMAMDEFAFLSNKGHPHPSHDNRDGYQVVYPDGYISWSPKDIFESAYREVTALERNLF